MAKPGDSVRDEPAYKAQPKAKRSHWQKGDNDKLSKAQKKKLDKKADDAAKYDRKTKKSAKDFPRKKGGKIDHGALVRNVKQYVEDALEPDKDIAGTPAPYRGLGDIVDICSTPQKPVDPSKDPADPDWVCTQHARYMAGIMRALGYPVREVTVGLSQKGKYTYQESAIQVWFEGKWHFADPYLCLYDPAAILGPYSSYTNYKAYYWDGTSTPGSHPAEPDPSSGWKPLKDPGADLQKRFYPSKTDDSGKDQSLPTLFPGQVPGLDVPRVASEVVRGEGQRSGVAITTLVEGVSLWLMDAEDRVTDGNRNEIPGAIRTAAGTPISFMHEMPEPPEPGACVDIDDDEIDRHDEWVFLGTRDLQAGFGEIGRHELTLFVQSERAVNVELRSEILKGDHPVTVAGLPDCVQAEAGITAVPFTVTIDPADAAFYVNFDLMVRNNVLTVEHYRPAADRVLAMKFRAEDEQG
mgnify:CR=1 FL=1